MGQYLWWSCRLSCQTNERPTHVLRLFAAGMRLKHSAEWKETAKMFWGRSATTPEGIGLFYKYTQRDTQTHTHVWFHPGQAKNKGRKRLISLLVYASLLFLDTLDRRRTETCAHDCFTLSWWKRSFDRSPKTLVFLLLSGLVDIREGKQVQKKQEAKNKRWRWERRRTRSRFDEHFYEPGDGPKAWDDDDASGGGE